MEREREEGGGCFFLSRGKEERKKKERRKRSGNTILIPRDLHKSRSSCLAESYPLESEGKGTEIISLGRPG